MATRKTPVKTTVKKADTEKKAATTKKVMVNRGKPFTTQKKVVKPERVQTAEGWKRSMIKMHKTKKTKETS